MDAGLWVWPTDEKAQRKTMMMVAASPTLVRAMKALVKSKEGLSNSELDELTADSSNWMTFWAVRQLTSLGFIDYSVDLFGGPARYRLTDLGRSALAVITGQPVQQKPPERPAPAAAPTPQK